MRTVAIMTDSSSGITQTEAKNLGLTVVPLCFSVDDIAYEEGVTLSREFFFEKQQQGAAISTAQPNLKKVLDLWEDALRTYEQVLYIPISSDLSGSCHTAMAMAAQPEYAGRVIVADAHRIATPLRYAVMDAFALAEEDLTAEEIRQKLETYDSSVYLAVDTLKYLQQGGRISAATAVVGTMLNIKPVVEIRRAIEMAGKCRGMKQARAQLIELMRNQLNNEFRDAVEAGQLYLMAASAAPEAVTVEWVEQIRAEFPGLEVLCDDLSLSICCHTGPNALGIGCARRLSKTPAAEA